MLQLMLCKLFSLDLFFCYHALKHELLKQSLFSIDCHILISETVLKTFLEHVPLAVDL